MAIYEIEFQHAGKWHFLHQHTDAATAKRDEEEYSTYLNRPLLLRVRTPAEEAALVSRSNRTK